MSHNDRRLTILETTIVAMNATLLDIRQEIRDIRQEIRDIRLDMKDLQKNIWHQFLWLMGMIIGLAGLLAHVQHWI